MDSLLLEKGLKIILSAYQFHEGESVIMTKPSDRLEGAMAKCYNSGLHQMSI